MTERILEAVDIVCLNCVEDTLSDNTVCSTCPVRKLVDAMRSREADRDH